MASYTDATLHFATVASSAASLDGGDIFVYPNAEALQDESSVELFGTIVVDNVDSETTGQTKEDCF